MDDNSISFGEIIAAVMIIFGGALLSALYSLI